MLGDLGWHLNGESSVLTLSVAIARRSGTSQAQVMELTA